MNGRTLVIFICVLFAIGIFWMIGIGPKAPNPEKAAKLFEPVTPPPAQVAAVPEAVASGQEETTTAPPESPVSAAQESEKEEGPIETAQTTAEEPATGETTETTSDEPPEVVEYTPAYGTVTFPHMAHMEDFEIDCGGCHHEDMEGGMAKCGSCHESTKKILHDTCKGCHSKLKSEGKDTGPVKCKECHIK